VRIRYTKLALADLDEAAKFIRADDPAAAHAVISRLRDAIGRLAAFPDMGRTGRVPGTRELIVAGTPFIVAYRATGRTIDVLAIVHVARRWPSSFSP